MAGTPLLVTDLTAELAKAAANAFLATEISFINAMAEVSARRPGPDITALAGTGEDLRGSARPRRPGSAPAAVPAQGDLRALRQPGPSKLGGAGPSLSFLRDVATHSTPVLGPAPSRQRATWPGLAGGPDGRAGASFKAGSDDIRIPALAVATAVSALGAQVTLHDPAAADHAAAAYPHSS